MGRRAFLVAIGLVLIVSASPAEFSFTNNAAARRQSASLTELGLLAPTPAPVLAGAALAAPMGSVSAPEDLVFGFRGGETTDFWKYSISQNQWTAAPDAPAPVGDGAALVAMHSYTFCPPALSQFCIAAVRGGNTTDFWIFDIQANRWCSAPNTPAPVGVGGAIAQLQQHGHTFVLRGGGYRDFWRFDDRSWIRLADAPGPVDAGGSLVGINYGTASHDDALYALQGGGSTAVWKYDVPSNSWSHQVDAPDAIGVGGAVTSPNHGRDGTLDVLQGGGSSAIWSLDIASNTWTRIGDGPAEIRAGGANTAQFNGCDFAFAGGGSSDFFSTGIRDCRATSPADFSLSFDPPTLGVSPGTKIRAAINIVRTGGFAGSVTLAPPSDPPQGIKLPSEFEATTEDRLTFKIKIKGSVQPGIYPLIFVGVGGTSKIHAASLVLIVQ
jgi:hypothetical protein